MGNYWSGESFSTTEVIEKPGGLSYSVLIEPASRLPPLKFTQEFQRTTRFQWHYQLVESRRQQQIEIKIATAAKYNDKLALVEANKTFNQFCAIDPSCFKVSRLYL